MGIDGVLRGQCHTVQELDCILNGVALSGKLLLMLMHGLHYNQKGVKLNIS